MAMRKVSEMVTPGGDRRLGESSGHRGAGLEGGRVCSWAFKVSGLSGLGPATVFKHLSVAVYKVPMFVTLMPRRTGAVAHREQASCLGSLPREARELFLF